MDVDLDAVKVYDPIKMQEGIYCSKIMINGDELQFQLPKNTIRLNTEKKKCIISVVDPKIQELIKNISQLVMKKTSDHSNDWFGKCISFEECEQIYKEALLEDKLYSFYDENTNFYTSSQNEIDPETLDEELKGIPLIKCGIIVFTKTSFFIRWEVSQLKIKKEKKENNNVLVEYSIRDLEEHANPIENINDDDLLKKIENITLF